MTASAFHNRRIDKNQHVLLFLFKTLTIRINRTIASNSLEIDCFPSIVLAESLLSSSNSQLCVRGRDLPPTTGDGAIATQRTAHACLETVAELVGASPSSCSTTVMYFTFLQRLSLAHRGCPSMSCRSSGSSHSQSVLTAFFSLLNSITTSASLWIHFKHLCYKTFGAIVICKVGKRNQHRREK